MITIDFIDENVPSAEKPKHRTKPVEYPKRLRVIDRVYTWALHQQNDLLQVAHRARLAKLAKNGGLSIDVQRYGESGHSETLTVGERYVNRLV